ncbi:ABC transporter substrate-binding protein [Bartonella vinsonii]|uniref:ABC transporter, periplasmic substrate-binding protein n=1 Tax=Bartonella vinsonii subsp. berkhoffii str. Tweed TaxID=1094502 RepID=N6VIR8_BARVB|nr:ABC transporter substrate-binding protein [Bartonella vinsonii]AGF76543.1 ABC transporter, periplasmic substrate-binding protein [Bartonella vinsonii subsp. berkhoffii str. Winnie]ENN93091.1 ABC transporter, periplasmic substrate-binding protein [Bartonella vinsonii subsp. berkhoffii str. Tweed]
MSKRISLLGVAIAAVFAMNNFAKADDHSKYVQVAITQIMAHPAADTVRKGVIDALTENGYKQGENFELTFLSAQGNISTAIQVARKFVGDKPDVIVAISTPSAQTVLAATRTIPVVFAAISDPIGAKIVSSLTKPGGNVTGTSDRIDVAQSLKLLQEVKPDLKKLGYLYNASEANSISTLKMLQDVADKAGIEIIPSSVPKPSDVQAATRALVGKVDVIFIPADNTVLSVLEGAVKVTEETNTPLFTVDSNSIGRGPFMTQGVNFYDVGLEAGKMVVRILKGEKPGDMDIMQAANNDIRIDMKAAKKAGIIIPQAVMERATKIIQ